MKKNLTSVLSVLLAVLFIAGMMAGCANDPAVPEDTTAPAVASSEDSDQKDETAAAFQPTDLNLGGEEFVIYGSVDKYNMIMNILSDEITGSSVQDAKYTAREKVESLYNVKLVEERAPWDNRLVPIQTACQTGDTTYDVAFLYSSHIGTLTTSGYLNNMYEIESADITKPWYDQRIRTDGTIKNKYLFYLLSDAQLMALEGTWAIFYNKGIAETVNLENPYDYVRSGKWTFEKLKEMASSAASLNGDDSWSFSQTGHSIYGMASFKNFINAAVTGCGEFYVLKDSEDVPYYAFGQSETVYDVAERIVALTGATADGTYISANSTGKHYLNDIFKQGRSLFCGAELKAAANELNDMADEFGLLPIPKYNEDQESYYSNILWSSLMYTIPTCVKDVEKTAVIMDALSYYNYDLVVPMYSERVSYRGLKDADSVEMVNLIHDTRYFVWGITYGWLTSIEPEINTKLDAGISAIAGNVKSSAKLIPVNIQKTLDELGD